MFFKLLQYFIFRIIFNKDEYKLNSKKFNPLKFIVTIILTLNLFFTIHLLIKIDKFYNEVAAECPKLKEKLNKKETG